jgi:acetyl-CoA carboxylase carboxyltransferase component
VRLAWIAGMPIGIVANNGVLFSESALKGAFHRLCTARHAVVVLAEHHGFMVGREYEAGGTPKTARRWHAVANANVPGSR